MSTEILLGLITFFTSTIAGIIGLGGGMILIAVLPSFLPINALVPVHGLTQLSSNLSRAVFGYKDVKVEVIPKFLLGSIIGVGFFATILYFISLVYVPLFIGIYILLSLWSKKFNEKIKRFESYIVIGFFQSGFSIVVGATGPIATTLLVKDYDDKHTVVATAAALMTITHTLKVFTFMVFGFVFFDYIGVLIAMIIAAIIGSWAGTKLRDKIDGKKFMMALKILLSAMAIKLILGILI